MQRAVGLGNGGNPFMQIPTNTTFTQTTTAKKPVPTGIKLPPRAIRIKLPTDIISLSGKKRINNQPPTTKWQHYKKSAANFVKTFATAALAAFAVKKLGGKSGIVGKLLGPKGGATSSSAATSPAARSVKIKTD
ncbi:MAG: hypothetical protein AAGI66_01980 [Cyanobacteria bacterium P01_H01_bin.74]